MAKAFRKKNFLPVHSNPTSPINCHFPKVELSLNCSNRAHSIFLKFLFLLVKSVFPSTNKNKKKRKENDKVGFVGEKFLQEKL